MLILKLKALADDTRLQIINILFLGQKKVSEITKALGKTQPTTSIALKQLLYAGIINQEKKGKNVYYELKDKENIKKVFELLKK